MKLAFKFYAMVGVPLVLALALTLTLVFQQHRQWSDARRVDRNLHLMQANNRLVTQVQRERGRSAMFLAGNMEKQELVGQRQESDLKLKAFETALTEAEVSDEVKNKARQTIARLAPLRQQIDQKAAGAVVVEEFRTLIAQLLALDGDMARDRTSQEVARAMNNIVVLEEAKESAGQLRANLSGVLAADKPLAGQTAIILEQKYGGMSVNLFSPSLILTESSAKLQKQIPDGAEWKQISQTIRQVLDRRDQGKFGCDAKQNFVAITSLIDQIDSVVISEIEQSVKAAQSQRQKASYSMTLAIVIGSAIFLAIGWFCRSIVQSVLRDIYQLVKRSEAIAQGDLSNPILDSRRNDEIGELIQSVNHMQQALSKLVSEVKQSATSVAAAATEIAASSEEMASGMGQQTQQVTQISAAIEEMSSSIVEVAKKSGQASQDAQVSGKTATQGGQVVQETIDGMNTIAITVRESANAVQELGKRGEQIGQIIEVINDIADQTNLLALNAAIEAARAGEHGRGFAVVADEVRKLADRTTKATEEIAQSIQAIQKETGQAVTRMNAGTEQVQSGVTKAGQAGESLQCIVESAQGVAQIIRSIAAAAEQQSAASEEISRNVENVSAVSKQAAEGASQAAMAAAQLSTKAEQLQSLVSGFKTTA